MMLRLMHAPGRRLTPLTLSLTVASLAQSIRPIQQKDEYNKQL
jgi:hypothetical protein